MATKTKQKSKIDIPSQQSSDQPVTTTNKKKPESDAPRQRVGSRSDAQRATSRIQPTDQMRDMLGRMRNIEADPDDPGYPDQRNEIEQRVDVENLPAVANNLLTRQGFQIPQWYRVADLPGNMAQAIRTVGRRLFRSFTNTPTDNIYMIGNLGGMGPNTAQEVNAVVNWIRQNGQEVSTGDIDFSGFIPGYNAEIKLYSAGGIRWLLVRDFAGNYIYSWPESDSVEMNNRPRLRENLKTLAEHIELLTNQKSNQQKRLTENLIKEYSLFSIKLKKSASKKTK
jgi:hypothetical protein